MKYISLFFFLSLLCSIVYAGSRDPNTPDSKYIEYGKKFNCIGKIHGTYKDKKQFFASGVAIDSHHVLTAAHAVKDSISCNFILSNGKSVCLKDVTYHKNFKEIIFGKYDIAIGYTEEDIGLDFYPDLYETEDEVNKLCSISGYGFYGTFDTGAIHSDGNRRAGSNVIDYIDNDLLICSPSRTERMTELEFIIGTGDSGGGLFIENRLAGINSCVLARDNKPNSSYNDEGGHTRISKYKEWIRDNKTR